MQHLIPEDYTPTIRREILSIVGQDDPQGMELAELAAIEKITSYLNQRYNCAKIFTKVLEYDPAVSYAVNDLVYYRVNERGRIYQCTVISSGNLPTDTDFFAATDPRSKLIIEHLVNLVLWTLHSSASPQKFSEVRAGNYDYSIKWLEKVNNGSLSPDLPKYDATTGSADDIPWGSNPKAGHGYA